jgi:predicted Zn-dependent protease
MLAQFLRESPDDPWLCAVVADDLMSDGHLQQARALLETCFVRHPRNTALRATLADCYVQLGELELADQHLRDGMEDTRPPRYWRMLGLIQHQLHNDPAQAVPSFSLALVDQPDDWNTRHQLALALLEQGETSRAEQELRRVEEARQLLDANRLVRLLNQVVTRLDGTENRFEIAEHYRLLGWPREARAWYLLALETNPSHAASRAALSELAP